MSAELENEHAKLTAEILVLRQELEELHKKNDYLEQQLRMYQQLICKKDEVIVRDRLMG